MTRKEIQKKQCQRQGTLGNLAEGPQLLKTAFDFFYDMNTSTIGLTKKFIWVFLYSVMKTWINFLGNAIHCVLQYGTVLVGFPGVSVVKNLPANAGGARDTSSIPQLRRFPIVGNGNSLQYSFLENPMDGGAWRVTVQGLQIIGHDQWMSMHTFYVYVTLQ